MVLKAEFSLCGTENIFAGTKKGINNHERVVLYVTGNLVSQGNDTTVSLNKLKEARYLKMYKNFLSTSGQSYFDKHLTVRLAAGAWCCTCFFLVQIYSTTLISHLTSPNQKAIISSFFEIADTPDLSLTVDKGYGVDQAIKVPFDRCINYISES